ncbi:MAG: glycosyltransferase family A protein [Arenicella sp.]
MIDITVVMMTHAEGDMAKLSLESLDQAVDFARESGLSVEKIITLDNPDEATINALKGLDESEYKLVRLTCGDLGKVRNHVSEIAQGEYMAVLDGDDLWSFNWLMEAHRICKAESGDTIVHPEFNWLFEGVNNIFAHSDLGDDFFDMECLRSTNPWDSLCFCKTDIIRNFPYVKRQIKEGFAYEDWNWNRRTFEAGIQHIVAKDTVIFKRRRNASQGAQAAKRGVIAKPSSSSYYDYY